MLNNTIRKELLNFAPYAFKALHHICGADFNKPYDLKRVESPFTVNKLLKAAKYNRTDSNIFVFVHPTQAYSCYTKYAYIVKLSAGGTISLPDHKEIGYPCGNVSAYWRKLDFNDHRKLPGTIGYIFSQPKEYAHAAPEAPGKDTITRYKAAKRFRFCESFIELYTGKETQATGYYTKEGESVLDKSGYYVQKVRHDLKDRADTLRKEKDLARVKACPDFLLKLSTLRNELATAKKAFIKAISEANTAEQIERFTSFNFTYTAEKAYKSIERYAEKAQAKSFRSLEEAETLYNDTMGYIFSIKDYSNGIQEVKTK